jgi:hypothetical protein
VNLPDGFWGGISLRATHPRVDESAIQIEDQRSHIFRAEFPIKLNHKCSTS